MSYITGGRFLRRTLVLVLVLARASKHRVLQCIENILSFGTNQIPECFLAVHNRYAGVDHPRFSLLTVGTCTCCCIVDTRIFPLSEYLSQ